MKNEKEIEMGFEEENEFAVRDELRAKRKDITSFDELVDFLKYIEENCNTGYGTAPRAIAQAALAVLWYLCEKFGITGFQAGCAMWDFITDWSFRDNKCGLKIVDYDNMLYPQYGYKFEKTISPDVWKALQEQASENLKENASDKMRTAHPDVIAHWKSIIDGKVPFGYSIKEG